MFVRCFNDVLTVTRKVPSTVWKTRMCERYFNGVSAMRKRVVLWAEKRCFQSFLTVRKKVFQRCLNSEKKRLFPPWKKRCLLCTVVLKWQEKCFNVVGKVTKEVVSVVKNEVLSQWFYSEKKGVLAVFEQLQKRLFPRLKKRCFLGAFTMNCFTCLSMVVFPPLKQIKGN